MEAVQRDQDRQWLRTGARVDHRPAGLRTESQPRDEGPAHDQPGRDVGNMAGGPGLSQGSAQPGPAGQPAFVDGDPTGPQGDERPAGAHEQTATGERQARTVGACGQASAEIARVRSQWWDAHSDAPVVGHRRSRSCPSGSPVLAAGGSPARSARPTPVAAAQPTRAGRALAVLHHWDRRRAAAWSHADPSGLARLYTPGSRTGRRDVADLERWRGRGLRVVGLHQQVAAVRLAGAARGRFVLVVTDRTVGAVAVGDGRRTPMPQSAWATHRISLRRSGSGWQVVEARLSASRRGLQR